MSFNQSITYSWTDGKSSISNTVSTTANSQYYLDLTITGTGSPVVQHVNAPFAASEISAIYVTSNNGVTFDLNTSGTGDSSGTSLLTGGPVAIAAGTSFQWISGNNLPSPITGAFNYIVLTYNGATSTSTTANVRFLVNETVS